MQSKTYDYAVIGGDMRQLYLAAKLAAHNNQVCHFGLCGTLEVSHASAADSLRDAVENARVIIGPIPLGKYKEITGYLSSGQHFFAGCILPESEKELQKKGVLVTDLMQEESLAVYNSIATAEGALCEAIAKSPLNLHGSHCAVLGFGRCGKTLVQYLSRLFCLVDVYTSQPKELAEAKVIADAAHALQSLHQTPDKYDFVFNTIPAKVISPFFLERMKDQAIIIDIASAPGGMDYDAARRLGVKASHCLGLPGKYAPLSSAEAIAETIIHKLIEQHP